MADIGINGGGDGDGGETVTTDGDRINGVAFFSTRVATCHLRMGL